MEWLVQLFSVCLLVSVQPASSKLLNASCTPVPVSFSGVPQTRSGLTHVAARTSTSLSVVEYATGKATVIDVSGNVTSAFLFVSTKRTPRPFVVYSYTQGRGIFVVSVHGGPSTLVSETETPLISGFHVSPDETRLVFGSSRGVFVKPIHGDGAALRISTAVLEPDHGSIVAKWSPDGTRVAFKSGGRLYVALADVEESALSYPLAGPLDLSVLVWSRNSRVLGYHVFDDCYAQRLDRHVPLSLNVPEASASVCSFNSFTTDSSRALLAMAFGRPAFYASALVENNTAYPLHSLGVVVSN